jgi:MOSC domain-containing protein YiiM
VGAVPLYAAEPQHLAGPSARRQRPHGAERHRQAQRRRPRAVGALGIEGDEQADLTVHGGLSKAVYAYPHEHYPFWQTVRAQVGSPLGRPCCRSARSART